MSPNNVESDLQPQRHCVPWTFCRRNRIAASSALASGTRRRRTFFPAPSLAMRPDIKQKKSPRLTGKSAAGKWPSMISVASSSDY